MKFTKKIMTMATCVVMAASSMVGMSASAVYEGGNTQAVSQSVTPYAAATKTLSMTPYTQETNHWCWAACAKMVLKYYGVSTSQTNIVISVKGYPSPDNNINEMGGTGAEIATALNSFYSDGDFAVVTNSRHITFNYIKNKIAANKPVIMTGTLSNGDGHAIVCYGYDTSGEDYILYIIDPAVGRTGTLTASSSDATSYSMSVTGQPSTSYTTATFVSSTA